MVSSKAFLTLHDDEIAHEKKIQCPNCAQIFGKVAMEKFQYQTLQRVTDKMLKCLVCGYEQIRDPFSSTSIVSRFGQPPNVVLRPSRL